MQVLQQSNFLYYHASNKLFLNNKEYKMRTLYISDLDGTLLDNDAKLSEENKFRLNTLLDKGMMFTVATARTFATVVPLLNGLKISCPVILMNGVMIYDIAKNQAVDIEKISHTSILNVLNCLKKHNENGFLYTWNNELTAWYEKIEVPPMKTFYEARRQQKNFIEISSLLDVPQNEYSIYFCVCDTVDKLQSIHNELKEDNGLNLFFYDDIYNPGYCFLEIASCNASKFHAANKLRSGLHVDKVIGFGDNMNDLPLLNACDEFYAVENAHPKLKKAASGIIERNIDCGVAAFLEKQFQR